MAAPTVAGDDAMRMYEGVITELTGGSITIELSGRLGILKLPLRMVVCERPLAVGQKVRIPMGYAEVLHDREDYV